MPRAVDVCLSGPQVFVYTYVGICRVGSECVFGAGDGDYIFTRKINSML